MSASGYWTIPWVIVPDRFLYLGYNIGLILILINFLANVFIFHSYLEYDNING